MDEDTPTEELPEDSTQEEAPDANPPPKAASSESPSGQKFSSDTPSMDEIMRRKKPVKKWVDIPLDPDVAEKMANKEKEIEDAETALARERTRAQSGHQLGKSLAEGSQIQDLTKKIERLEGELEDLWDEHESSIVRFWFQDIGKKKYDDLVGEHPPTKEQLDEWKDEGGEGKLAYNTETFPPVLLSKASLEPKISLDYANQIFEDWGNWEVIRLFNAAQSACAGVSSVPKSRRSLKDTDTTSTSA